jgi:integrase
MSTDLTITQDRDVVPSHLACIGQIANQVAAKHTFANYQQRKAANTLRRQTAGLILFMRYLAGVGATPEGDLATYPQAWEGITWGLVEGFVKWQLIQGYAVSSVNVRLSTIKTYARLAFKAGTLGNTEYALIRAVEGYSHKESKNIDEDRELADTPTRVGAKKAEPKALTAEQVGALKEQPDTPQGRRDRLLVCLLFDHGLRVGEIAGLTVGNFDLKANKLRFYRPKVDVEQTHELSPDTLQAAMAYLNQDALAAGPLMRGSRKDGRLHEAGIATRNLTERVRVLGERVGLEGLSAHDGRHTWATLAAENKTPIDRLQDAGGWSSPAMPLRYVKAAAIANQGVKLG